MFAATELEICMILVIAQQSAFTWRILSGTIVKTADADADARSCNVDGCASSKLSTATAADEEDPIGANTKSAHLRLRRRLSLAKDRVRPAG